MINCKVFEPRHGFRAHHFIYKETETKQNKTKQKQKQKNKTSLATGNFK